MGRPRRDDRTCACQAAGIVTRHLRLHSSRIPATVVIAGGAGTDKRRPAADSERRGRTYRAALTAGRFGGRWRRGWAGAPGGRPRKGSGRRPTLPRRCRRSTIGAGELNCRVRDGNGCGLPAGATRELAGRGARHPGGAAKARRQPRAAGPPAAAARGKPCGQAWGAISNGQLSASPRLHTRPIQLVVCECPRGETWSRAGLRA